LTGKRPGWSRTASIAKSSGDQEQRHAAVGQALRGQLHPRVHALAHEPLEQLVAAGLVARQPIGLLRRRDERVVADVRDVALERRELVVPRRGAADAEQLGLVAAVAAHDRDDRLAREVAGQERDIGLVDVPADGVDELPPRLLGGVQVAGDVDPRRDGVSPVAAR
jgi:hypothetical protein